MQLAFTPNPDATATITVRRPPADEVERVVMDLDRFVREDPAAADRWLDNFHQMVDEAWEHERDVQRRMRNATLALGIGGLFQLPAWMASLGSDNMLSRASAWGGIILTGWCFYSTVSNTIDLARLPPAWRGHED